MASFVFFITTWNYLFFKNYQIKIFTFEKYIYKKKQSPFPKGGGLEKH